MRSFVSIGLISLALGLSACSDNDDGGAQPPRLPAASEQNLQQVLDDVVSGSVAPGVSVTIDHPHYQRWQGSAGVANIDTRAPLTIDARFRAGSMLKTAVATATLQLVEEGALSLDATLTSLLPDSITSRVPYAERITVRQLLNHTSGIAEFADAAFDQLIFQNPKRVWTLDDQLERVAASTASFEPGAGWSYSNSNYVLLGEIVAQKRSAPWRSVLTERVFARAGLTHTALPQPGVAACDGCSRGYEPIDARLVDFTEVDASMAGASGGESLVTTPADLATFLRALFDGKLFQKLATLELMRTLTAAPIPEEAQTGYGFGLARFELEGVELIGHLGGTAGFQGFMLMEPKSGVILTGYMNQRGDLGSFIVPVIAAAAALP